MKCLNLSYFALLLFSCGTHPIVSNEDVSNAIQPYEKNPRYWQYKGEPVLLLGASDDDNLFQWPEKLLIPHLDSIKNAGGNYIRNTMSDRVDKDFELYPFERLGNGKYNLNKWNDQYWERFSLLLDKTHKRDIIVQIEIWDRFDYSTQNWSPHPYNPTNNVNYTLEESGFDPEYPEHPGKNKQPFFFTTPLQHNNEVVLPYQQAFVKKLLSISLSYDHILYCIDNETSGEEAWATYWVDFVRSEAGDKKINITQMWNEKRELLGEMHKRTLDYPERYNFIDISQNSWNQGYNNWANSQNILNYIKDQPRPVNSTKIYGSDTHSNRTSEHADQTFFRNILGGFASSRFHRPPSGLGLSEVSASCLQSLRMVETKMKLWDLAPRMELLADCDENEAYLAAKEGESYLLYFPKNGSVNLDLRQQKGPFTARPIDIPKSEWGESYTIEGGGMAGISSDNENGSLIVLHKL